MTLTGNILITGGSGTLGRAIVRTAQRAGWDCAISIYSRSELRQAEMCARYPHCRYILGDVRDYDRMAAAVAGHDLVIHAAAVKRIPEAEQQPRNCFETNVIGSMHVARACIAGNVPRCVGISTDKACRAVTAYGASKLALEKLFQAQPAGPTIFTLVRYGNVVASNGSVIPLWRKQYADNQALTVTDLGATRFWMGESDAVDLIQQAAGALPGTITVPKMGALTLAEMAQIVAPGAELAEVGYRSVEKRHEDLVHPDEIAADAGDVFLIGHPEGRTGYCYTSDVARRLSRAQFLAMLSEAEDGHDQSVR